VVGAGRHRRSTQCLFPSESSVVVGTSKQKHRCLPTSMFKKFGIDGRYIVRETSIFHKHRYFGLWYGTKTRSSLNKCVIFPNDKKSNKNKMRNSVNN
jgi:hypothetical protein